MLIASVGSAACNNVLMHLVASAIYLHLDELLVVVITKVVHQLHGEWFPTGASWAFAWVLNSATDVVPQFLLTTGCTLENCRSASEPQLFTIVTVLPCCMPLGLHLIGPPFVACDKGLLDALKNLKLQGGGQACM